MSRFLQDVYGVDRLNQAVAVLGGATSPSYEAVSLHNDAVKQDSAPDLLLTGADALIETHQHQANVDAPFSADKSSLEAASALVRGGNVLNGVADEVISFDAVQVPQASVDSDLLTRFQTLDADNAALLTSQSNDPRGALDAGNEPVTPSSSTNSMASFLEMLVARVEGATGEVSTDLDGSAQGAVRELVRDIGTDLSRSVRAELQDNVAGVGRELAAQVIDSIGIEPLQSAAEPLLSIDYYGESATFIHGTLDSIGQPIGSISLPQVGPFVGNLKSELAGLAA